MSKKGSLKNYIILLFIMLLTILIVLYSLNLYKQYNDEKLKTSVISSVLSEIKYDDLTSIVKERDYLIVYMCSTSELKCRSFESKFKDYLVKNNLTTDTVYLSLGYNGDRKEIIYNIYNDYKSDTLIKKISNYPTILIFKEGKIIDLYSPSKDSLSTVENAEEFLSGYIE